VVAVGVVAQKFGEAVLRQTEEPFVVPEGVIGVETDGRQHSLSVPLRIGPFLGDQNAYIVRPIQ
jgi:hypothetical protein